MDGFDAICDIDKIINKRVLKLKEAATLICMREALGAHADLAGIPSTEFLERTVEELSAELKDLNKTHNMLRTIENGLANKE